MTTSDYLVSTEDKENYLEHPIPAAHVAAPGQQVPSKALTAHAAWVKGQKNIVVIMLMRASEEENQDPNQLGWKKGIKHCKRWYWNDPELENKWYKSQLYEMHLLLNPSQIEELENELTSREELAVLQVEFADMEGRM
nr:zinc finger, CCHC-type [Tanacetum cinerariifolium]